MLAPIRPVSVARTRDLLRRVRWLVVAVVVLCLSAILWVLLRPDLWPSCVVLVLAAVALAIVGRGVE